MRRAGRGDTGFAQRLKEALRLREMTPAELARMTGIGESTISRYLHSEREPVYANLVAIGSALGVGLDFLAGLQARDDSDALALLIDRFADDLRTRLGLSVVRDAGGSPRYRSGAQADEPGERGGAPGVAVEIPVLGRTSDGKSFELSPEGPRVGRRRGGIPRFGERDSSAYGVVFEGDSMGPRILDGDILICSPSVKWRSGTLGLLRTAGGDIEVAEIHDAGSMYLLRKYNPASGLAEVPKSDVAFVHSVVSIRPASATPRRD